MRIIILLAILSLTACHPATVRDKDLLYIDRQDLQEIKHFKPEQLIDSITYIALETSAGVLLGNISHLKITDEHILLINEANDSLYVFDRQGKFLHNIGKKGRGPGEHVFLDNFIVHQDTIIIFDSYLNRLTFYTLDNRYIQSKDLSRHLHRDSNVYRTIHDLSFASPGYLIIDHGMMDKSHVSHSLYNYFQDTLLDIGFYPFELILPCPHSYLTLTPRTFMRQDARTYCFIPFNDTLFECRNGKLIPHLVIDAMKEELISQEQAASQNGKDVTSAIHILFRKGTFLSTIAANENHLFFVYSSGNEKKEIIWNRLTGKGITFSYDYSEDDYIYAPETLSCAFLFSEEYHSSIHHNRRMEALKSRLTEEDNPVIAIYHLKSDF